MENKKMNKKIGLNNCYGKNFVRVRERERRKGRVRGQGKKWQ